MAMTIQRSDYGCGDNSCVFGSPGGMATNGGCRCFEEMARSPEGRQARRRLQMGIYFMRQKLARYDEAVTIVRRYYTECMKQDILLGAINGDADAFLATEPKGDAAG